MLRFGINCASLIEAGNLVAAALGIRLELHESSFRGGDYLRAEMPAGVIYVQSNLDPLDNDPFEHAWPSDQFVLYFDGLDDEQWNEHRTRLRALEASAKVKVLADP